MSVVEVIGEGREAGVAARLAALRWEADAAEAARVALRARQHAAVREALEAGWSERKIGAALGVGRATVAAWAGKGFPGRGATGSLT